MAKNNLDKVKATIAEAKTVKDVVDAVADLKPKDKNELCTLLALKIDAIVGH